MSNLIAVTAESRTVTGKEVASLRRAGWTPAVIYGQNDPIHIQLESKMIRRALRNAGSADLFEISLGTQQRTALAREIQIHPTKRDVLHIDFYEINMKETVRTTVELVGVGVALPVAQGLGDASLILHEVEIECLPGDLVSEIEVNFALIQRPDDLIHVRDIVLPKGVTILADPDETVARFARIGEGDVAGDNDAPVVADAVEVITKGKKEDEKF